MKKKAATAILLLFGALTGFLNGFFGGGGGMITVPLLIYAAGLPVKRAHATAILVILPLSVISGLFYFSAGSLTPGLLWRAGAGVTAGGILGALLLKKLSGGVLRAVFILIMAAAGIKLLF
jgi:uncharacterized membrane protein YfcA